MTALVLKLDWTAISGVVVAVCTVVLVFLAAASIRSASSSASAAKDAAESARRTAEIAAMQVATAEAALPIDFEPRLNVEYDFEPKADQWIRVTEQLDITCTGATVYVHEVTLEGGVVVREDRSVHLLAEGEALRFLDPTEPPLLRHKGEWLVVGWEGLVLRRSDRMRWANVGILYSLSPDGVQRKITRSVAMPESSEALPP